ncbi:hypothetical protein N656DRAFT_719893 [Canariomyces notabilis]|uniref:Uncharacterized protein n=1 Tax=Canariomyces notabilis TaxID=2074819 RepID=A0AAN6T896_9PEZI|nr:hypothetical protein N656DRAFT_719893 [Canariomyces arenarius]
MYRTKHFRWKLTHVLAILAHLGLTVAASTSYIYNLNKGTRMAEWRSLSLQTSGDSVPCRFAVLGGLGTFGTFDVAVRGLLLTCLAVGAIGAVLNAAIFTLLLSMEPNRIMLTEGEQHWRKQVVTFFGCVLNLLLAGAGVGLAGTLGTRTADSKSLIAPLVWALIQATLSLAVAIFDAVKNHNEGKDLLD